MGISTLGPPLSITETTQLAWLSMADKSKQLPQVVCTCLLGSFSYRVIITGLPVTEAPDFSYAVLRDGTKIYPRKVLTTTKGGPGLIQVEELDDQDQNQQVLAIKPAGWLL